MPPHTQPASLQEIVLHQVISSIIKSCINICSKFGCYDTVPCRRAASEVHVFLLPKIKPILDSICDRVSHSDLCQLSDKRIFYAVIVHSATKYLNLGTLLSRHSSDYLCYHLFCIEMIAQVNNLTSLTLCQKNVTEQTLAIVADTSYKTLQSFTVTPIMKDFADCFSYLSKCKELQYLKIISISLSSLNSSKVERLRNLISSLPKLEYFESTDLVKLLAGVSVDHLVLSIARLREVEVDGSSMAHVIKICPKLNHIDITLKSTLDSSDVLKTITNSELTLTTLKLGGFLWQNELDDLITVKGASLVHINIDNRMGPISFRHVYIIGKYCPNIKILGLDVLDSYTQSLPISVDVQTLDSESSMFSNLVTLCFGWYQFGSYAERLLPIILSNAHNLSDLMLQCCTSVANEDALEALLCLNPLTKLAELSLIVNGPGTIAQQSMSHLIDHCQRLRGCYIYGHIRKETRVYLQQLYGRIRDQNLDLQIHMFER